MPPNLEDSLASLDNTTLILRDSFAPFIKKWPIQNKRIYPPFQAEGNKLIASIIPPTNEREYYFIGYVNSGKIYDLAPHCCGLIVKKRLHAATSDILQIGDLRQYILDSFETNKSLKDNLLAFKVFKIGNSQSIINVDTCMFIRLNGTDFQYSNNIALWAELSKCSKRQDNKREKDKNLILVDNIYGAKASNILDKLAEHDDPSLALNGRDVVYATMLANLAQRELNFRKV